MALFSIDETLTMTLSAPARVPALLDVEPEVAQQRPHLRPCPMPYVGADRLAGRVVLMTGAETPLGCCVASLFAREGADVALVYPPDAGHEARATAAAVEREGRRVMLLPGNVASPEFCRIAVDSCVAGLAALDVLVQLPAPAGPPLELDVLDDERWDRTLADQLHGPVHLVRAAAPFLPAGGAIVQAASSYGTEGCGERLGFAAAQGALIAWTRSLAQLLSQRGVRVNCVTYDGCLADDDRALEHVAPAFVFFACPDASARATGQVWSPPTSG